MIPLLAHAIRAGVVTLVEVTAEAIGRAVRKGRAKRGLSDGRPDCDGEVIGGSGGHRVHRPCGRPADWWHPDDLYAYCDEHVGADRSFMRRWPGLLGRPVGGPVGRVSPTCPACDDDPADRCGVCGRRRSRVEA